MRWRLARSACLGAGRGGGPRDTHPEGRGLIPPLGFFSVAVNRECVCDVEGTGAREVEELGRRTEAIVGGWRGGWRWSICGKRMDGKSVNVGWAIIGVSANPWVHHLQI